MSEDDPFENLDPPEDREGDPFENLDPPEGDEDAAGDTQPASEADEDQFWDEMRDAERIGKSDAGADEPSGPEELPDVPVGSESGGTPERGPESTAETESGDPTTESDGEPAFEEEFIEEDAVAPGEGPQRGAADPFDGLDAPDGDPFGEGDGVFEKVDVESLDVDELWALLDEDADESAGVVSHPVEVSKHRYCEQCEFFAEPPGAHCTHAEAEILEYIGMDNVRVVDCPVVAEQRQLENEE